jgi:Glycosyltransferase family 87
MINPFRRQIANYLLNLPLLTWIILGFLITFFLFFPHLIFLHPSMMMQFNRDIPVAIMSMNTDFIGITAFSYAWLHTGVVPTIIYPPLTLIFFAPFTLVSYETGYKILVGIILICYLSTTLIFPRWINQNKKTSAFDILILVTGLFSYGLQFELEQGQWNLIAFSCSVAAIYIFHKQPKYRWLAYLLFSLSIQLKLFPAIFVFTLIEDFSDWKKNIQRIVSLGVFNILALFILGPNPVLNTMGALKILSQKTSQNYTSRFNLSIPSFTSFFLSKNIFPRKHVILWLTANSWLLQLLFFTVFGFCFLTILFQAYKKNVIGFNPYVFLACFIGACIIPSISLDYKLSMLPGCIAISIPEILLYKAGKNQPLDILLVFIFSLAYSSMLYLYTYKPKIVGNNFPALMLILIICTISSWIKSNKPKLSSTNHSATESNI